MKKQNFLWMAVMCFAIFFSCQSEDIIENESSNKEEVQLAKEGVLTINHTYDYYGKEFRVSYLYNEESDEVLGVEGDVDFAQEVFGNEEIAPKSLFFENPEEGNPNIKIKVFDNGGDLEAYTAKVAEGFPGDKASAEGTSSRCNSHDINGSGNFYFYKHAYYNTEMTGMRRTNRYYYRHHWVGSTYNDQLSSLKIRKPTYRRQVVYLYQHSCYGGKVIGFYCPTGYIGLNVGNLKWYTMSGWWWWRKSWNDQVSSTSGWAW
ncbi:hypothetical protein P8625_02230 [Tenacibaculum tangerinum]|uniref:Uncharacterized protein n=1 Tax=Tenacibaculum tangerinum TaxID=3038772 RepID=A0ABY8L5V8_9FLAO|nr:hypothetical protein [Tenacibaculum tangerinum]WGH76007.1 hypothetical protein P8625_02230 [Tenacibaculum tangerinum]